MSRTIDQQVVEMQFDNSHFERNVRTSMSTIDKLKQSLNLTGASKGLENINEAARKNNFGVLGSSVEAVKVKFSAMEIAGITALTNITNSAVNAGKRIVKALTIDPVTTGFNEYELKMGAIQTIMSSTGESLETVTKYLNELNEYSDRTIYSFSDMTQNIGKFTNAGVSLEDAVLAMKGISNEAALSGANANEAARAMYNLSQAMSMGYVQYIDWKSIENANMATVSFKEELIKTALQLDVIKKTGDDAYTTLEGKTYNMMSMFKDGMKDQWMTSEVLIETLKLYADETSDIGERAYKAATEIKTFSQMLDTLKESAQSGWAQTWETIFGGYYEAKDLWTDLGGFIDKFLGGMSDARNSILKTALGSSWEDLTNQIENAGLSAGKFSKVLREVMVENGRDVKYLEEEYGDLSVAIKAGEVETEDIRKALNKVIATEKDAVKATGKMTLSIEELEKVANRVMDGGFGNGAKRIKALSEAGYDYATVQNRVNEILGSSVRHISELTEEQKKQLATYANMSDAQIKNANLSSKQTEALAELKNMADATGGSVNDLISDLERPSGRMLLLESFKNVWKEIQKIFEAIGTAWKEVFGEFDSEEAGNGLYHMIERLEEFTSRLDFSEETLKNFSNTVSGVFTGFKIPLKIGGTAVLSFLNLLNGVLKAFGTDLLGVTGAIGERITAFGKWLDAENIFGPNAANNIGQIFKSMYDGASNVFDKFMELTKVKTVMDNIKKTFHNVFGADSLKGTVEFFTLSGIKAQIDAFFTDLTNWIPTLENSTDVIGAILDKLSSIGSNMFTGLMDGIEELGNSFIGIYATITGTDPATIFESWSKGVETVKRIGKSIADCVSSFFKLDAVRKILSEFKMDLKDAWNTLTNTFGGDGSLSIGKFLTRIEDAFLKLKEWINNLKDVDAEELGGYIIEGFAIGISKAAKGIGDIIAGIANLIIGIFKSLFDMHSPSKLMMTFGGFIIAGLIMGLTQNKGKVGDFISSFGTEIVGFFERMFQSVVDFAEQIDFGKVLAIALSAGLIFTIKQLADALKLFGGPLNAFKEMCEGIGGAFKGVGGALKDAIKMRSRTEALKAISLSIVMLAGALWVISQIPHEQLKSSCGALILLAGVMLALTFACSKLNEIDGIGINYLTLLSIAGAFLALAAAFKLMSTIETEQIISTITGFTTVFAGIIGMMWGLGQVSKGVEKLDFTGLGRTFIGISLALLIMVGVIKLAGNLKIGEIIKGTLAIGLVGGLFVALTKVCADIKDNSVISGIGGSILKISMAIVLIVGVIKLINTISPAEAIYGGLVIAAIGTLFYYFTKAMGTITDNAFLLTNMGSIATMLLSFSGAMLLVSAAMRILAGMSVGDLLKAGVVVTAVAGLCAGLIAVSNLSGEHASKAGLMLIEFGVALLIMSAVVLLLKEICKNSEGLGTALGVITWIGAIFAGLIAVTKIAGAAADIKATLITLTVAIGILAVAVVALSLLDRKDVATASAALGGVIAMFTLLVKATGTITGTNKELFKAVGTIVVLSMVVVLLGYIIKQLAVLDPESVLGTAKALSVLLLSLSASTWLLGHTKGLTPKDLATAVTCIGALSIFCGFLATMLRDIQLVNPEKAIPTAIAIGILLLVLSASFKIISSGSGANILTFDDVAAAVVIITTLSVAILAIAGVIKLLENVKPANAIGAAIAVGTLLLALSVSFGMITGAANTSILTVDDLIGITAVMLVMVVTIGAIAAVIKALEKVNPVNAIGNAIALGILILALSVAILPLTAAGTFGSSAVKGALALTAMAIPLATFAYAMSKIKPISQGVANSLPTLVDVMFAMTSLMAPLVLIGKIANGKDMALGILALAAMGAPLLVFGLTIEQIPDVGYKAHSIKTLTDLMYAMTSLLVPIGIIGAIVASNPLIAGTGVVLGILALTAMVVPLAAFAEEINKWPSNMANKIPVIEALTNILDKMVNLLIKASLVSPLALGGLLAIEGIIATVVAFGRLAIAVGALMDEMRKNGIDAFVDTGIDVLEKLSEGIGRVLGGMVTGFGDKVLGQMPYYGEQLSKFIENAGGFITGLQDVGANNTLATGAKNIADAVVKLVSAEFISSYMEVMSLGTYSLSDLGTELSNFIDKAKPFFDTVGNIDSSAITGAKTIADTIQALSVASLTQVITDFFSYKPTDWAEFGEKLANFGSAMGGFNESIKGMTFDQAALDAVKTMTGIMVDLQQSLDPIGGVVSFFCGEHDLGNFGDQIKYFGEGIKAFSDSVAGGLDVDGMKTAASIGTTMSELQNSIDPVLGLVEAFTGSSDLRLFGAQISSYAESLKTACNAFKDENGNMTLDTAGIDKAKEVGVALAELQKAIPTDKLFDGKSNLADFGNDIQSFGYYLKAYSNYLTDVSTEKMSLSTEWAKDLVSVARSVASIDTESLGNISKIKELGEAIKDFASSMTETAEKGFDASGMASSIISSISTAFDGSTEKLKNIGSDIMSSLVSGIKVVDSSVSDKTAKVVAAIIKGLKADKDDFKTLGKDFIKELTKGLNDTVEKSKLISTAKAVVSNAAGINGIKQQSIYDLYKAAGKYCVQGFAEGINKNSYIAKNAATNMAKSVARAVNSALQIMSPSRVFMKTGKYVVEGLAKGISINTKTAVNSSVDMADSVAGGFSKAISRVSDLLNGNMEAQPTIRPVLDLSDVESGAATIGSMFGNPSVGVMTNLGSINTMMNRRNQNGINDDVVEAINNLGSLLGMTGGNNYTINGITYDDGSAVSDAVNALIRATRIEGRA